MPGGGGSASPCPGDTGVHPALLRVLHSNTIEKLWVSSLSSRYTRLSSDTVAGQTNPTSQEKVTNIFSKHEISNTGVNGAPHIWMVVFWTDPQIATNYFAWLGLGWLGWLGWRGYLI